MCGIAGIVRGARAAPEDAALVRAMTAALGHRGPDAVGHASGEGFELGHTRLAILDLANGAQPLRSADGGSWLVYNGEVYNHAEIARDLRAAGATLRTRCDTEVVLEALARWGTGALARFRGMFALAWIDTRRRRLVLARDRLGVKPLYFARAGGRLCFASEPRALLAVPGVDATPDPVGLSAFLSYRHALGSRTLYRDIEQVGAGELVEVDLDEMALPLARRTWWQLGVPARDRPAPSIAEASRLVEQGFFDAVRVRMIADVPLGAYLSGGLDSSLIVAAMTAIGKRPVRSYCIGFPEPGYHEFEHARAVAERCGAMHEELHFDRTAYLDTLEAAIVAAGGPLSVPNEVPLLHLARAMKQRVSVVLSGEGADELFGGYGRIFRAGEDAELLRAAAATAELDAEPALRAFLEAARRAYGDPLPKDHVELFLCKYRYMPLARKHALLHADIRASASEEAVDAPLRAHFARVAELHPVEQFLHVFQVEHLQGLLRRLDSTTMAAGLEGRVPFTDHRLVEAVQELPWELKLRYRSPAHRCAAASKTADAISEVHDVPKWILREALGPLLPDAIVRRRKVGFPVPLESWFGGDGKGTRWMLDVLGDRATHERGLFDPHGLAAMRRALEVGSDPSAARHAFALCGIELWQRHASAWAAAPLREAGLGRLQMPTVT